MIIDLLLCTDILRSVDVYKARSTLLVFVFLASSTVHSVEVKVRSISRVAAPRSEKLSVFDC